MVHSLSKCAAPALLLTFPFPFPFAAVVELKNNLEIASRTLPMGFLVLGIFEHYAAKR